MKLRIGTASLVERFIATIAFRSHGGRCHVVVTDHIDAIDEVADDFETPELSAMAMIVLARLRRGTPAPIGTEIAGGLVVDEVLAHLPRHPLQHPLAGEGHGDDIIEAESQAALERAIAMRDSAKNQVDLEKAHQLVDRHAVRLKVAGLRRRHRRS